MTSPSRDLARRDLCWEALVRETAANPAAERGALNSALKAIREAAATEGVLADAEVAAEITMRAARYREVFRGLTLTPTALAKHWFRVTVPRDGNSGAEDVLRIAREEERRMRG